MLLICLVKQRPGSIPSKYVLRDRRVSGNCCIQPAFFGVTMQRVQFFFPFFLSFPFFFSSCYFPFFLLFGGFEIADLLLRSLHCPIWKDTSTRCSSPSIPIVVGAELASFITNRVEQLQCKIPALSSKYTLALYG